MPRKLGASPGAGQPWRNYQFQQFRLILVASRRDGGSASIVTWHTAGVNLTCRFPDFKSEKVAARIGTLLRLLTAYDFSGLKPEYRQIELPIPVD